MARTPIVDAHLDMAWNALAGRDYDLTAAEVQAADDPKKPRCMVTLRELERGGVAVAFGTLYVGTSKYDDDGNGIYETPPDDVARTHLDTYRRWEDEGKVRIIRTRSDLASHLETWETDGKLGIVLLIEGGDSIASPDALPQWVEAGVRVIGPAWSRTRYCGGTRFPGPLTALGRELLDGMRELGVILDISHMAEESFWQALDIPSHRVIATHSNVRSIVPSNLPDRHLSDEMIAALGKADAVIGVVPANVFLVDELWESHGVGETTLDAVKRHLDHLAAIAGWDRVGIGSDLDGGFGVDETPIELETAADLVKIGDVVPDDAREGVLGGNWLRMLRESLPA